MQENTQKQNKNTFEFSECRALKLVRTLFGRTVWTPQINQSISLIQAARPIQEKWQTGGGRQQQKRSKHEHRRNPAVLTGRHCAAFRASAVDLSASRCLPLPSWASWAWMWWHCDSSVHAVTTAARPRSLTNSCLSGALRLHRCISNHPDQRVSSAHCAISGDKLTSHRRV